MMKNRLFLTIIFLIIFAVPVSAQERHETSKGIVVEIMGETSNKTLENALGTSQKIQTLKVKVLDGSYRGEKVVVKNQLTSNQAYDISVSKGDRVILEFEETPNNLNVFISDKDRLPSLISLIGLFFASIILVEKSKSVKFIFSSIFTISLIFFGLIPAILGGYPIVFSTVCISIASAVVNITAMFGINRKSIAAVIGTVVTVLSVWGLSALAVKYASLNGISGNLMEELLNSYPELDFQGLLISAIILISLGIIIDTCSSIANLIFETKNSSYGLSFKQGMDYGKNIIASKVNILFFVYLGSTLPLLLMMTSTSSQKFFNLGSVVTEIVSALVGSMGIILCVPVTAIVAALLIAKKENI